MECDRLFKTFPETLLDLSSWSSRDVSGLFKSLRHNSAENDGSSYCFLYLTALNTTRMVVWLMYLSADLEILLLGAVSQYRVCGMSQGGSLSLLILGSKVALTCSEWWFSQKSSCWSVPSSWHGPDWPPSRGEHGCQADDGVAWGTSHLCKPLFSPFQWLNFRYMCGCCNKTMGIIKRRKIVPVRKDMNLENPPSAALSVMADQTSHGALLRCTVWMETSDVRE